MFGKNKYSRNNWKKGFVKEELLDSLMRHVISLQKGEEFDPEHGLCNTAGVLFNAMAYEYCRINNKFVNVNNRQKRSKSSRKGRKRTK